MAKKSERPAYGTRPEPVECVPDEHVEVRSPIPDGDESKQGKEKTEENKDDANT